MASSTQQQFRNILAKREKEDSKGITKDEIYTAGSIAPITGDVIAIKELPNDVKQIKTLFEEGYRESDFKKLGMGALYATAVTAGLIPVAGVVGRTAKSFLKPVIKKASDEMSSVFKTASGDTNMTPALAGDAPTINKSVTSKEPTSSTAKEVKSFNDLRKGSEIKIDNPPNKDVFTGETYVQKKIKANNEYMKKNPKAGPIGLYEGITGYTKNIKFNPKELMNIKGEMGEDIFRMTGESKKGMFNKLKALEKNIKDEGYKPTNIKITVTENGTPYITEGNHRLAEALKSNRSEIVADINYLRGGEAVDGPLNPNKIGIGKEPTSSTILKKDDYEGQKVFHSTANDFKEFGFVSKNDGADIGFHVGTPVQAQRRTSSRSGERTLPLQLRTTLKPARIPDLSSFKEPRNWLAQISVNGKDKDLLRFLMQDPKDAKLILDQVENKLPIKMNGTTYYMLPDAERMGMDKKLWKDLVLESGRAVKKLNTTTNYKDRQEWFETIKKVANKNGYDSYVYKNEFEVGSASPDDLAKQIKEVGDGKRDPSTIDIGKQEDSYMLLEEDQAKGVFGTKTKGNPDFMKNKGGLLLAKGGVTMNNQMEMFDEGGLKDEGGTVDPVSGNDVPPGSTQEEVRDDIPAQLSEGEFVFPADVVRFIGLEKLMQMRQKAKMGLQKMEDMGQMGNSDEATMPDNLPFDINDLDMEDEEQYNSETTEMAKGGVIKAATGTLVNTTPNTFTQQSQFANQALPTTNTYTAPTIPTPTAAPVGGYTPQFSGQTGQSGQTVIPTFQNLLGNTDGRYDELREYRSESGMILKIPFVNGAPIYPIPEGYTYVDPEEVVEEAPVVESKTPTTTRVAEPEDNNDSADQDEKNENVKNWGTENPQFINVGGILDTKTGLVSKSDQYSISKVIEGGFSVPGAISVARGLGEGFRSLAAGGIYEDDAKYSIGSKGEKSKTIFTGKELNDLFSVTVVDPRDKSKIIRKKKITKTAWQDFDKLLVNKTNQRFFEENFGDANITGKGYEDLTKKEMEEIQAGLKDKGTETPTVSGFIGTDDGNFINPKDNYVGSTGNLGGAYGPGGPPSQDYDDDDQNDGFDSNTGGGGSDDYGSMFKQGGLLGKRKIKPKKMKLGGLASR